MSNEEPINVEEIAARIRRTDEDHVQLKRDALALLYMVEELRRYATHLDGCLWAVRQPDGSKLCDCGVIELLHPGDPRAARGSR